MYSNTAARTWVTVAQERSSMSSFLMVAKKLSATALSQHCRGLDNDWTIRCSVSNDRNSVLVYCTLAAAVGVEDRPGGRPAVPDGHRQGVADEFGAHVIGDRPADDRGVIRGRSRWPGTPIPPSPVGDVADVDPVEFDSARPERPLQPIDRRVGEVRVGDRGRPARR